MRPSDIWRPFLRSHPAAKIAVLVSALPAVYVYTDTLARPDLAATWQQVLLDAGVFGYNQLPPFMLLLCFGTLRFSGLERVRRAPDVEVRQIVIWILLAAMCVPIIPVLAALATGVLAGQSVALVALVYVQLVMELTVIGLLSCLPVNAGIGWGFVVPGIIAVFGVSGWVFGAIMPWLPNAMFFLLVPVADWPTALLTRVLPFAALAAVLILANQMLHARRDYLKS